MSNALACSPSSVSFSQASFCPSHLPSSSQASLARLVSQSPLRRSRGKVSCSMRDWRSGGGSNSDGSMGSLEPSLRRRLENAWSVQQESVPVACESCLAQGMRECEWCSGSGYFVLGDKMLCEVPSRNTQCLICHGHGSVRCSDCLGTGFRARWLEKVLDKKK